jgi:hypothetical protein
MNGFGGKEEHEMRYPKTLSLPDSYIRFIAERGDVLTVFHGAAVIG